MTFLCKTRPVNVLLAAFAVAIMFLPHCARCEKTFTNEANNPAQMLIYFHSLIANQALILFCSVAFFQALSGLLKVQKKKSFQETLIISLSGHCKVRVNNELLI